MIFSNNFFHIIYIKTWFHLLQPEIFSKWIFISFIYLSVLNVLSRFKEDVHYEIHKVKTRKIIILKTNRLPM